jgi:ABC-type glycerol-3-phosphate transport system substrate-binding protein
MKSRLYLLLLLAALTACGAPVSAGTNGSIRPDGQVVILWHSAEGSMRRALLARIDEFNATNAWGILIVPEYHGNAADMQNALTTAIAAKRMPDLILGRPLDALRLGDAVTPVESYVLDERYGLTDADLSDLYPALLDANRDPEHDGALLSFPVGGEGTVMVYNVDRLAALGYLTPPNSWPLFKEVCLVATADSNGDRQTDVYGFGFAPRPEFVAAWFLSRGAPLLSADGRAVGFENENGLKTFETLAESEQGGCLLRTPGINADVAAFSTGRVAMIFANTSELRDIEDSVENGGGFRWGVAPVPHGRLPATLDVTGLSWILLRSTPQKQLAAWQLVRWFAMTEQTIAWAVDTGQLPLRKSAADKLAQQFADNPNYRAVLDLLPEGHAEPLVSYWPNVAEAMTRSVLAVLSGNAPAGVHQQALAIVRQIIGP